MKKIFSILIFTFVALLIVNESKAQCTPLAVYYELITVNNPNCDEFKAQFCVTCSPTDPYMEVVLIGYNIGTCDDEYC